MSAMNKANARQNSRNKAKFEAKKNMKTWEVRKAKKVAAQSAFKARKHTEVKKVPRGTARALRRGHVLAAAA